MRALRFYFAFVFAAMLGVIVWASSRCALFDIPREVLRHPWFLATLLDAYLAFVVVWLWVAWKERSPAARILWLPTILLWGNPAIALYVLRELARARREGGGLDAVVSRQRPGELWLPTVLLLLAVGVYLHGARHLFAG